MTNMERMMCIGFGKLYHHPLGFLFTMTKIRALFQYCVVHPRCVFLCGKIQIDISFDRFDVTDALHASNLGLSLFGDLLRPLWDRFPFSLPGTRFICCRLEEGRGNTPLSAERDRLPLQKRVRIPLNIERRSLGCR